MKVKVKVEEINGIMSEGEGEGEGEGENRKQGGREGLGNGKWKVESGKESGNLELAGADATHNTQHTTHNTQHTTHNTQQHTTHNSLDQTAPGDQPLIDPTGKRRTKSKAGRQGTANTLQHNATQIRSLHPTGCKDWASP